MASSGVVGVVAAGEDNKASLTVKSSGNNNNNNNNALEAGVAAIQAQHHHQQQQARRQQPQSFQTLSSPGSATALNHLQLQNFQGSTSNNNQHHRSRLGRNNSNNANLMMTASVAMPPSTAHPTLKHVKIFAENDADEMALIENDIICDYDRTPMNGGGSAARRPNNRQPSANSSKSDDSNSSSGEIAARPRRSEQDTGSFPLRPPAAHPKRRQSAAARNEALLAENGGVDFIESTVEVISPPGAPNISIGLLNSSQTNNKSLGRSNTQAPPDTCRTNMTIPNWAPVDDFADDEPVNTESVQRVERWLDSATIANGNNGNGNGKPLKVIAQKQNVALSRSIDPSKLRPSTTNKPKKT